MRSCPRAINAFVAGSVDGGLRTRPLSSAALISENQSTLYSTHRVQHHVTAPGDEESGTKRRGVNIGKKCTRTLIIIYGVVSVVRC